MSDDCCVIGMIVMVGDDGRCFFYDWFLVWVGYVSNQYVVRFDVVYFVDVMDDFYWICIDVMIDSMVFGDNFIL